MRLRLLLVSAMVLVGACALLAQTNAGGLAFGQAYGTAGFRSQEPAGSMADAANVVLVFTAADGHRNLVLTQQTGDYIALLEPGRYCIAAYTRAGESLRLVQDQLKCIAVERGKDARLDVMLVRSGETGQGKPGSDGENRGRKTGVRRDVFLAGSPLSRSRCEQRRMPAFY